MKGTFSLGGIEFPAGGLASSIDEEITELLSKKGYTRELRHLGHGHTRNAYVFLFESGPYQDERVVKIPKKLDEIDPESITTIINLSKGDVNRNEIKSLSELRHKNIIRQLDAIELPDGRIATVEEHFSGSTLEDIVGFHEGGMGDQTFEKIFSGVIGGLIYLNDIREILHRDIKPSNIFINQGQGEVRIGDLQNARRIRDIEDMCLPTRGGTPYTHPELLNALLNGEGRATKKTEIYALGATMYYALTGRHPFNYRIVKDERGMPIEVNGKLIGRFVIVDDDYKGEVITEKRHRKNIESALAGIPRKYRKLIGKCLSFEGGYNSASDVKENFEEACKKGSAKILEKAWRYAKLGALASIISVSLSFGAMMFYHVDSNRSPAPTLSDLLTQQSWIEHVAGRDYDAAHLIRDRIKESEFDVLFREYMEKEDDSLRKMIEAASYISEHTLNSRADRRLCFPLMRSYLAGGWGSIAFQEPVVEGTFVPKSFVRRGLSSLESNPNRYISEMEDYQKAMWMTRYIQHCFKHGDSLEDVYARALCTNDEIASAIAAAQNEYVRQRVMRDSFKGLVGVRDYLGASESETFRYFARTEEGSFIPGFRDFINPAKRRIIDTAVALYGVTDPEGNMHPENYDEGLAIHASCRMPGALGKPSTLSGK